MPESLGALSTPWTMIEAARRPDAPPALRRHCLEALAFRYRDPVAAYLSHFGVTDANDRDDLAQTFFLRFLEDDWLSKLDRERGSFRGLLVVSLRHFVQRERDRGIKRHPASPLTRLSATRGHVPAGLLASSESDPERAFNHRWARQLLKDAVAAFREDCRERGLSHYFDVFDRHDLHPDRYGHPSYADTAAALGRSASDVKNHLARARRRFAQTLRDLVRQTVATDEQAEEEMAHLERYFDGVGDDGDAPAEE